MKTEIMFEQENRYCIIGKYKIPKYVIKYFETYSGQPVGSVCDVYLGTGKYKHWFTVYQDSEKVRYIRNFTSADRKISNYLLLEC